MNDPQLVLLEQELEKRGFKQGGGLRNWRLGREDGLILEVHLDGVDHDGEHRSLSVSGYTAMGYVRRYPPKGRRLQIGVWECGGIRFGDLWPECYCRLLLAKIDCLLYESDDYVAAEARQDAIMKGLRAADG